MLHDNRRKSLILLEKKIVQPVKSLILHNNEIGTFYINCTGTPNRVFLPRVADKVAFALLSPGILALSMMVLDSRKFLVLGLASIRQFN
jgi:hypothetical protein